MVYPDNVRIPARTPANSLAVWAVVEKVRTGSLIHVMI